MAVRVGFILSFYKLEQVQEDCHLKTQTFKISQQEEAWQKILGIVLLLRVDLA